MDSAFINADQLKQMIEKAQTGQCMDEKGAAAITILDFRNEFFLNPDNPPPAIDTVCKTQRLQLDDLLKPEVRAALPRHGKLVTITETGNRDAFAMRYLHGFGFDDISGLQFGMRGWIKLGYPTR